VCGVSFPATPCYRLQTKGRTVLKTQFAQRRKVRYASPLAPLTPLTRWCDAGAGRGAVGGGADYSAGGVFRRQCVGSGGGVCTQLIGNHPGPYMLGAARRCGGAGGRRCCVGRSGTSHQGVCAPRHTRHVQRGWKDCDLCELSAVGNYTTLVFGPMNASWCCWGVVSTL
jgi:hypothetical protein